MRASPKQEIDLSTEKGKNEAKAALTVSLKSVFKVMLSRIDEGKSLTDFREIIKESMQEAATIQALETNLEPIKEISNENSNTTGRTEDL